MHRQPDDLFSAAPFINSYYCSGKSKSRNLGLKQNLRQFPVKRIIGGSPATYVGTGWTWPTLPFRREILDKIAKGTHYITI
jgi:hypothetical protein